METSFSTASSGVGPSARCLAVDLAEHDVPQSLPICRAPSVCGEAEQGELDQLVAADFKPGLRLIALMILLG
jgi:hypothetical protein